jgi:hypothetical protein
LILLLSLACLPAAAQEPAATNGFRDRTAELGLKLAESHACWADVDNDGWSDLCAGGTVWRNEKGQKFSKLAEGVGEVVAADFDNDGFVDLFSFSALRVFRNKEGKAFEGVEMPELPRTQSLGACWGDFNGDGFADLYVGGYESEATGAYPNLLLLNQQGKSFKLAWSEKRFRSRGVTACDFDRDGDLDAYVSNYRLQPNVLWLNDGLGKLTDVAAARNAVATSPGFKGGHSIGAAWGDFDNDGRFDLFAGNFAHVDDRGDQPKSRFLRNLGADKEHAFEDRGPCGVFYQESYASPSAGDYDNDGDLDLFFTTVYGVASFDRKNNPVLFRNDGGFAFADATAAAKLEALPPTYQAAWADFDRDGDLDLVTAGKLFENVMPKRHWLALQLSGDGSTVNRSAIGAQVRIVLPMQTLTRHVEAGTGEGNQNDLLLHFGLGDQAGPVRLEIFWPGGKQQVGEGVEIDRVATVIFGK